MNKIEDQSVDGIIRLLLGMVILYQSDKGTDLDLDRLVNELESATKDDFSVYSVRGNISHAIKLCPYHTIVDFFKLKIEG